MYNCFGGYCKFGKECRCRGSLHPSSAMASLPMFNPSPAVASRLDLLASAALAPAQGQQELPETATSGSGMLSNLDKLHTYTWPFQPNGVKGLFGGSSTLNSSRYSR